MNLLAFDHIYELPVAGVDEAGRGCLAGDVYAAAVILLSEIKGLDDSKKLPAKKREELAIIIKQNSIYAIGVASIDEIDSLNILKASQLAMIRAVAGLSEEPATLLIDGNRPPDFAKANIISMVKGDSISPSIAAASILAKTARDEYMQQIHQEYPYYNWAKNKSYATPDHYAALKIYGASKYHRKSFNLKLT